MAYPNQPTAQHYRAYANAAMTVGKVRQVVMLYDGVIRFVQQAVEAIGKGDFETRYNQLVKASEVIVGLQSSLDFEQGGDIAKLLYDYYASMDARLFTVHRSNDTKICESVIKELKMMRAAWDEIDRNLARQQAGESTTQQSADRSVTSSRVSLGAGEMAASAGIGVSA